MKRNGNESRVLELIGKFAIKEVKKETGKNGYWWPPACAGFLHQPKRPTKKVK